MSSNWKLTQTSLSAPLLYSNDDDDSSSSSSSSSPSSTFSPSKSSNLDTESSRPCQPPWRAKSRRRVYRLAIVTCMYVLGVFVIMGVRVYKSGGMIQSRDEGVDNHVVLQLVDRMDNLREKRDVAAYTTPNSPVTLEKEKKNCTPRSVENFPPNFFTFQETRDGGMVVHILIALYMFACLAIVCDDYFVPSLEHICEDLGLQADVAGATFMAAGSSAPEFMTSVVGVFFAESDVGTGTIVGSAVFNILFIIGVCGVFAGMVVELTWYPLVRDTVFYLISVLTLFLIIRDKQVMWYEATVMIILYMFYILLMYFNRRMEKNAKTWVRLILAKFGRQPLVEKTNQESAVPEEMKRARAHSRISQSSLSLSMSREHEKPGNGLDGALVEEQETSILDSNTEVTSTAPSQNGKDFVGVSEYESVWNIPENYGLKILWFFLIPAKALFYVTIPDSRRPGIWSRLYLVSFVVSVAWISGLTYIMVWMVTIAGDSVDIPDTVMGLTLLAAGTSVPDCLASIFVARDGYGDMAVSNSLGSNVFDILLCLGIPWLIESIINNFESITIVSQGLTYSSLTLLATVAFLLASMAVNKFRLNKSYGCLCLLAYVMVVILSCLYELNVFGDFNPPVCPRD